MKANRHDERGITLIMTALMITAIFGLAALVIDGGFTIADHRQDQNAADAAALAGADALNTAMYTTGSEASVYNAVSASVAADSNAGSFTCSMIDQYQNVLGSCPTTNTNTGFVANVDGVLVTVSTTRASTFAQVANGPTQLPASGVAAAQVEAWQPTAGGSLFIVCAVGTSDSRSAGSGITPQILNTDNSINSASIGQSYVVKGNPDKKECGTNGSFKGIEDGSQNYSMPGAWAWTTGNHSGPVRNMVAGACNQEVVGCILILPLCYYQSSLPSSELYCVQFGEFQLTGVTSNTDTATFLGTAFTVTTGQGGGIPTSTQARIVQLTR